jgi:hypothetical protein
VGDGDGDGDGRGEELGGEERMMKDTPVNPSKKHAKKHARNEEEE